MRKNIIALMLALPLLFVFVVFSSGNVASLGVTVSANGIVILEKPENDTLTLDLASYENDYKLTAEVSPSNASDKSYSFRVEAVEGAEPADLFIDGEGHIVARSTGSARIVAVSTDGGYTDSITAVVSSSKPLDFDVTLTSASEGGAGAPVSLTKTETGYSATLPTGRYSYGVSIHPSGFSGAKVECAEGFAAVDEASGSLLLPFSGSTRLKVSVAGGYKGTIEKYIDLDVQPVATGAGFTVNGGAGETIALENSHGGEKATFYVEAPETPAVAESPDFTAEVHALEGAARAQNNRYQIDLTFKSSHGDKVNVTVQVGENVLTVEVSFLDFAFLVRSDLSAESEQTILLNTPVTFYAYPVQGMKAEGVSYKWETDAGDKVVLTPNADGSACTVEAKEGAEFKLTVTAMRGGVNLDAEPKEVTVHAVRRVTSVTIVNRTSMGMGRAVLAGSRMEGGEEVVSPTRLRIVAYNVSEPIQDLSDLIVSVSDEKLARLEEREGAYYLTPLSKGEVTVNVSWQGNESLSASVKAAATFYVAPDAVEVTNSPDLFTAVNAGKAVVLGADILLGTDEGGSPLSVDARRSILEANQMRSTYNIFFYTSQGRESEAKVKYVLEFKNDLYGNGHTLNAEYFTNELDGSSGHPREGFFRGPLCFVSLGQVTSVAGQDNIAFLVRTKGVTLYNATLLGCSDSSLIGDKGEYDLTKLNYVGTTLEVNADANILNCRIRNGRNVVRAYGGNRNGDKYFIEKLQDNLGCDDERIHVRIEGCILQQAREFILKLGANRALQASTAAGGAEPDLLGADGKKLAFQTNNYLDDDYFYERYVLTDVTLKDSVLETSGLFTVGIESNFSGAWLNKDTPKNSANFQGWAGTGGTSFASVLRLEGDVRLYDWKRLDLVDSSTLIYSDVIGGSVDKRFELDIAKMLNYVCDKEPKYGDIIEERDGQQYVHGGIAFYGGGKNYSQLDVRGLSGAKSDLSEYKVNISILQGSDEDGSSIVGLLPNAAGNEDFRFFMYGKNSANNYDAQLADAAAGKKYEGVSSVPLFA